MTTAPGGDVASAQLLATMWSYAALVLEPARALRRAGLAPQLGRVSGDTLADPLRPGLGPRFSLDDQKPLLLADVSEHAPLVVDFDHMADVYEAYVRPFSRPLFDEALDVLAELIAPDARLLDLGCGPGRELRQMARHVSGGEVVGVDLSAGMVLAASRAARAAGLDNVAFEQADAGALPARFHGEFDLAYSCLAHHHFPEPAATARSVLACLRPGGLYATIDPGPAWFNRVSAPFARWSDPGWISFHSPEEFSDLLHNAGFASVCWQELLPGFLLVVGQKSLTG